MRVLQVVNPMTSVHGPSDLTELRDVPADARLPTQHGDFRIRVFHEDTTGLDHVALTLGDMQGPDPVLVRVHSECLTGDAFGSLRCDCGPQLDTALERIQEIGWGCLVYLRQEGRGIGLQAKNPGLQSARQRGRYIGCEFTVRTSCRR